MNWSGLIPLQKAYTEAAGVRKRLDSLEQNLGIQPAQSALQQSEQKVAELEVALKQLREDLRDKETLVEDIGAKIIDREERLVKTNIVKEIQGLQGTLKSLRKQEDEFEEQVMGREEQVKQADQTLAEEKQKREELNLKVEILQSDYEKQKAELEAHYNGLLERENAIRAGLEPEVMQEFDRQAERRGGVAVAFVLNGTCSECHMSMAAEPMAKVRKGALVHCQNCRRILLFDESERGVDAAREKALREKVKVKGKRPSNRENELALLQLMSRAPEPVGDAYWSLHHWIETLDQFGIEWFFQTPEGKPPITRFRSSLMQKVRRGRVFAVIAFEPPDILAVFIPHHLPPFELKHANLLQKHHLSFRKDAWNGEEGYGAVKLKVGSPEFTQMLTDLHTILRVAADEALKPT
ncbi:MAG: zinc ribbon domain-containing protein [bacterium]